MKVWVVAAPPSISDIYTSWVECKAALDREPQGYGHQQWVDSRETAEAMLDGTGVVLPLGCYAFIDGDTAGGVGLVVVERDAAGLSVSETSTSVSEVFRGVSLPGLDSERAVMDALQELKAGLTEIAAAYLALREASPGSSLTIVYDREEVERKLEDHKKAKNPIVGVVQECDRFRQERQLKVGFRHKRAHQSEWVGRDDFAHWNNRADELASQKAASPSDDGDRWFVKAGLKRTQISQGRYSFILS